MADIVLFLKDIWSSYQTLSLQSKCIIGCVCGYFGIKLVGNHLAFILVRATKSLRNKQKAIEYEKGIIYLHIFPRRISLYTPNLSPFGIKLETWLRLHGIKYEVVETIKFSKATRMIPYILYNEVEYTDSTLITEFLSQEKGLNLTPDLSDEQQGISRALQVMFDEDLSMSYMLYRYVYNFDLFRKTIVKFSGPWFIRRMIERQFPKNFSIRANAHGIGRKQKADVIHIGQQDIKAASQILGDKPFMMGDQITTVDCSVFGHLSQLVYVDFPFPHKQYIEEHCQNLIPYMDRIKAKLWPDWDNIVKTSFD